MRKLRLENKRDDAFIQISLPGCRYYLVPFRPASSILIRKFARKFARDNSKLEIFGLL